MGTISTTNFDKKFLKEIESQIFEIFKQHFKNMDVTEVHVKTDEDMDGDPILAVSVVLRKEVEVKSNLIGEVITQIRDKLLQEDIPFFPLMSFMTQREFRRAAH